MERRFFISLILIFFVITGIMAQTEISNETNGKKNVGAPINIPGTTTRTPSLSLDGKTLVYVSNREGYWKMYQSALLSSGKWSESKSIDSINNFGNRETLFGGSCISFDGNTLYFCANFTQGYGDMDIWTSTRYGMDWGKPVNLGKTINSRGCEETPSISSDENDLYFVRNNNRAIEKDFVCRRLFVAHKYDSARVTGKEKKIKIVTNLIDKYLPGGIIVWQEPIALTAPVNIDCEQSPRIAADNITLTFSSVRAGNKGKADLFFTRMISDNKWSEPLLMDFANTEEGDMYASFSADGTNMYYTISNMDSVKVYNVDVPEKFRPLKIMMLSGTIMDSITKKPLYADIEGFDVSTNQKLFNLRSNKKNGEYLVVLRQNTNYRVDFKCSDYPTKSLKYNLGKLDQNDVVTKDIKLTKMALLSGKVTDKATGSSVTSTLTIRIGNEKVETFKAADSYALEVAAGHIYTYECTAPGYYTKKGNLDLSSSYTVDGNIQLDKVTKDAFSIGVINFATGKATLLPESFKVLDNFYPILVDNPDLKFEISGHTDNSGKEQENMTLSQARAQTCVDYFVKKGISADRLIAKGYGMTQPIVPNNSPANKAKNRRVELKVID